MTRGWRRGAGALIAGLLAVSMVSGCASTIDGTAVAPSGATGRATPRPDATSPAPRPAQAGAAGTAPALLGELTTFDPCSLTDPRTFAAFGTATFGLPDSLDDCLIEIKTSAAEPITLYIGGLDRGETIPDINAKPSTDLPGGLRIVEYDSDSSYCNRLLVFADGVTLSVNASLYERDEPRLCDIVKAAVDKAVEVLRDGGVRHRDFKSNSFGRIDPCEVVGADAVAAVPGLAAVAPKRYPAEHSCAWTAADNSTRLRVIFIAGPVPKPSGQGATQTAIADRSTVLSPTPEAGGYVFCGAQTAHIPFAAKDHSDVVEIAAVFVRMERGKVAEACRAASGVAQAVWPKLPKP
jgi:hypothetical protein